MKSTGQLKTIGDVRMPYNRVVVNPNDGYDLDLLTTGCQVKIFGSVSDSGFASGEGLIAEGEIVQENRCRLGTVELNLKTLKQLGSPNLVTLSLEDSRLLITSC